MPVDTTRLYEGEQRAVEAAADKVFEFLELNAEGGEYPLHQILTELKFPPDNPLHKEIVETVKARLGRLEGISRIRSKFDMQGGRKVLFLWFDGRGRKKIETASADGGVSMSEAVASDNGRFSETRVNGVLGRVLDVLKKNQNKRFTLKALAIAIERTVLTSGEKVKLYNVVMDHPNINAYFEQGETGKGRRSVELEWVKKATVKNWDLNVKGALAEKLKRPTSNHHARAPSGAQGSQESGHAQTTVRKRGRPKGSLSAKGDLSSLLDTIKSAVDQANGLRQGMINEIKQIEAEAETALERRRELISQAKDLKNDAADARRKASELSRSLKKHDRGLKSAMSQIKLKKVLRKR